MTELQEEPVKTERPWWKRLLFRGMLVFVGLIVAVAVAEVTLRVLYRAEAVNGNYWGRGAFEGDKELGFLHTAGYRGRAYRRDAFDVAVEIQPNHLRQASYASQLRQSRRLLILGDSYAFGIGVEEEAAFPSLLQHRLNPEGIGVINGAQTRIARSRRSPSADGSWTRPSQTPWSSVFSLRTM